MNKFHYILIFFIALQCINSNNNKLNESFFDSSLLPELELDSIPNFWNNDSIYKSSSGILFSMQDSFIDELVFHSDSFRMASVIVFTSKQAARAAMEIRIDNVACIFIKDETNIDKMWWYADCTGSIVLSLLKNNTIIELARPGNTFLFEDDLLWTPINDISDRIDNLIK